MPATCFDNAIWFDKRYRALPAGLRAALPEVVASLADPAIPEGTLTDAELRAGLLGPKRFAQLADALLAWGWLARNAAGCLTRAGILAPDSEGVDEDSPGGNALRMRIERAVEKAVRKALGMTPLSFRRGAGGEVPGDAVHKNGAQNAQNAPTLTLETAQGAPPALHIPHVRAETDCQTDSSPGDKNTNTEKGESVRQTDAPAEIALPGGSAFRELHKQGYPADVLVEVARQINPRDNYKVKFCKTIADNLLAAREQEALVLLGAVPGGAPPPPKPDPFSTEALTQKHLDWIDARDRRASGGAP